MLRLLLLLVLGSVSTISCWAALPGRIVGGEDATNTSIPWMVSLVQYGAHHCGGAIVNKKTIITAAHCLVGLTKRWTKIRAGSKLSSSGGVLIPVEDVFMHPDFDLGTMDNDIGIIRLKTEIQFTPTIQPIPIPKYGYIAKDGMAAMVSGWGYLADSGPVSEILQYLIVKTIDRQQCNKFLANKVSERMICAGNLNGGYDACKMDSGGPLVGSNMLIGIVSWGVGCAKRNFPGIYTNVASLRSWIDESLAQYGERLP